MPDRAAGRPREAASPPLTGATASGGRTRLAPDGLRRAVVAVGLLSAVMASLAVALVPADLDLDEASYYDTVRFYATQHAMPVLGEPGVSYEGQMGPVYYIPAAAVQAVFGSLGADAGFYAVRGLGVLLLLAMVGLTYALASRLAPARREVALVAATIVGLNPHLLALTAVSNDLAGIVIGMLAIWRLVVRLEDDRLTSLAALGIGALAGIAVITKPTGLTLVVALPLAALAVRRRRALVPAAALVAGAALTSGWWFVRNDWLYGEFGTTEALRRVGFPVVRGSLDTPGEIVARLSTFANSYWTPAETFGAQFSLPFAVTALGAALSLAAACGLLLGRRRLGAWVSGRATIVFALVFVVSISMHLVGHVSVIALAPRTTFLSYFVVASTVALGLCALPAVLWRRRPAWAALVLVLLVMDGLTLKAAHDVPADGRPTSRGGPVTAATLER